MSEQQIVRHARAPALLKAFVTSSALTQWGETIGVYASIAESAEGITLLEIQRAQHAPAGVGAQFMRTLVSYANERRKPIFATVTGHNSRLEAYYESFGFSTVESSRDDETGDVVICRPAIRVQ